jgi:hypothetical protein
MEILLQHRTTGLFVAGEKQWVGASRAARAFRNAQDAETFANAGGFAAEVQMVARFEQSRYHILLPLVGSVPTHPPRAQK